ncbi:MAG TPA: oligosaccharide flippase family protein [Polyangiaceae bacterium]|nr:oligosaccharide flippase family protein [Polyangiaceae bacterium]
MTKASEGLSAGDATPGEARDGARGGAAGAGPEGAEAEEIVAGAALAPLGELVAGGAGGPGAGGVAAGGAQGAVAAVAASGGGGPPSGRVGAADVGGRTPPSGRAGAAGAGPPSGRAGAAGAGPPSGRAEAGGAGPPSGRVGAAEVGSAEGAPASAGPPASEAERQATYGRRARFGVIALGVRSALQNVVVLVANVVLARTLTRADYGVFGILQFAMTVLKMLGDAGLAVALVQQKDAPDHRDLSSIWWLQMAIGVAIVGAAFGVAPLLPYVWPTLPPGAGWLLPGLALGLLFTFLRAVPSLLLERGVRFGPIGTAEFVGSIVFYGTAVALAKRGAGAAALVAASVGQAAAVALFVNVLRPWRPALVFDWSRVRRLMSFGLAFQGTNAVAFVNGAVTPLLVGGRLGTDALGVVQFAQNTAWFPTEVVGIVRRVSFPYFSRLQHDPPAFARELERAVLLCAIPIYYFLGLFLGVAPAIVSTIYSDRWLPAVPALYVYSVAISVNFFTWIGSAALEALGATARLFRWNVVVTLFNWPATLVAITLWPTPLAFAVGFALHMLIITGSVYAALRELAPAARPAARLPALVAAGLAVAGAGRLVLPWVGRPAGLLAWVLAAALLFGGVALGLDARLRGQAREWLERRRKGATRA